MIRIEVVMTGETGFLVAVDSGQSPATAAVVGSVHVHGDRLKAWLWKVAGRYPDGHTEAIGAKDGARLAETLRKRHQAHGAWWTA